MDALSIRYSMVCANSRDGRHDWNTLPSIFREWDTRFEESARDALSILYSTLCADYRVEREGTIGTHASFHIWRMGYGIHEEGAVDALSILYLMLRA